MKYHDLPASKKRKVDDLHKAIGRKVYKIAWSKPKWSNHDKALMNSLENILVKIDIIMRYRETVHFRTLQNDFILISLEEI